MNISVCIPSYKRPKVETLDYLPFAKVFVDENEYPEYVKQNKEGSNIISVPTGVQGNVARIRNYIIRHEFDAGMDAVCIVDDDMRGMYFWHCDEKLHIMKAIPIPTDDFMDMLEQYSIMCEDVGLYMWGVAVNKDALTYTQNTPFSFRSFVGGPFGVFLRGNDCWYDEKLPLKEDYDMVIQQCNKYRGVLRVNFIYYDVKQSEQPGGCAVYRNYKREAEQFALLQKKWGSRIVKQDKTNKGKTKKEKPMDYNPILKIPIKGV